jgi:hypothetical protein
VALRQHNLLGLEPSGRVVRFDEVHCTVCDGDRIVEDRLEIDLLRGVTPPD